MTKLKRYIPVFAALAGILGAVLRGLNLYSGYEPGTCLPIPGNLPQTVLIVLSIMMVLLSICAARLFRKQRGVSFEATFSCGAPGYKLIAVLSGAAIGVAGALGLYRLISGQTNFVNAIGEPTPLTSLLPFIPLWLLAIITTAAFFQLAAAQSRGKVTEARAALSLAPMFWACFDLIITFKDNGSSPFVSLYAFELFAAVALVFAFYTFAGFFYAKSNPGRFVCSSILGVFFSFTCVGGYLICALLGGGPVVLTPEAVLRYACFGAASVYLLANIFVSTRNLSR